MPVTDTTAIAQILFAETKDLVDDPGSVARLLDLRKQLAWMIGRSDRGVGWAPAVDPGAAAMATPAQQHAWQDCHAAAASPAAPALVSGLQPEVVLWHTVSPLLDPQLQHALPWVIGAQGWEQAGSAVRAGTVWQLWLGAGTQAARTGRWPDNAGPAVVKAPSLSQPGFAHSWIGVGLFLFTLGLLMYAAMAAQPEPAFRTAYSNAVAKQRGVIEAADQARRKAETALAEALALKSDDAPTQVTKKSQDVEAAKADATKARTAMTNIDVNVKGAPKPALLWQWLLAFAALLGLFCIVGFAVTGQVLGFLVDDRNRMSLARVQSVSWTLVVLSTYWIASAWNLGLAAQLQDPDLPLLPKVDAELWTLLGITVLGSPLLSSLILDAKVTAADPANTLAAAASTTKPPQTSVEDTTNKGPLDARKRPQAWSFLDLFTGETTINRPTVDVSRLQQFVFTLITLLAFGALTYAMFDELSGRLDALPKLSSDLVALLGLSHLAYLGAKGVQK